MIGCLCFIFIDDLLTSIPGFDELSGVFQKLRFFILQFCNLQFVRFNLTNMRFLKVFLWVLTSSQLFAKFVYLYCKPLFFWLSFSCTSMWFHCIFRLTTHNSQLLVQIVYLRCKPLIFCFSCLVTSKWVRWGPTLSYGCFQRSGLLPNIVVLLEKLLVLGTGRWYFLPLTVHLFHMRL